MGWKKYARVGVGLLGKTAMGWADNFTGGLASKVADKATDLADKNSGLVGSVMNSVGKNLLSDKTRNALSGAADTAIQFMPKGKLRTAMEKINNHAQGRDVNYNVKSGQSNVSSSPPKESVPAPTPTKSASRSRQVFD